MLFVRTWNTPFFAALQMLVWMDDRSPTVPVFFVAGSGRLASLSAAFAGRFFCPFTQLKLVGCKCRAASIP